MERLFRVGYASRIMAIKLTPYLEKNDLANIERSSSIMREWIQRERLWELLFQRAYPDQFRESYVKDHESHMYEITRRNLDFRYGNSLGFIYWKRLYQLNVHGERCVTKRRGNALKFNPEKYTIYCPDVETKSLGSIYADQHICAFPSKNNKRTMNGAWILYYCWLKSDIDELPTKMLRVARRDPTGPHILDLIDYSPVLIENPMLIQDILEVVISTIIWKGVLRYLEVSPNIGSYSLVTPKVGIE